MKAPPVQLGMPLDRSWYDPLLLYHVSQFTITTVVIPVNTPTQVIPADPNRWVVGFSLDKTGSGFSTPWIWQVGNWSSQVGGWYQKDGDQFWFNMQTHGLIPQQAFWCYVPPGGNVSVYATNRYPGG